MIDVLDALKIEKALFVGHGFAGVVVAHSVAKEKEKFSAAVMLGPVLPSEDVAKLFEARVKMIEENEQPPERLALQKPLLGLMWGIIEGMEDMPDTVPMGGTGSRAMPLQQAFVRQLLLSQNPKGYQLICKVIRDAKVPDYASIRVPTLIIAGK